jgi:hypothetical protein
MGILTFLFGSSGAIGQSQRFVSEGEFQSNLSPQTAMAPETLAQLRMHGVTEEKSLRLELFFYTNAEKKAQALAAALEAEGYQVRFGTSASDASRLVITGWTLPIAMVDATVVAWTDRMTRLGYEHDCEFDGWGTNPDQ